MDSQEIQLNLKEEEGMDILWIGVVYVNHRIRAKVYLKETLQQLMLRVSQISTYQFQLQLAYMLNVEPEYALGLKPMQSDIDAEADKDEEEKIPSIKKRGSSSLKQNEYSFKQEQTDELEEGQIPLPKDVVTSIQDLLSDKFYLVCYLHRKSQDEVELEHQQLKHQFTFEDDGEKSVKMTPKKSMLKMFETKGININECQQKAKKSRGDKRVLICPFVRCLKDFTETGNLKTHLRTHTGERPFVCSTPGCNKQFITKGHLKTHELIHSGDKPFNCKICGKSYSRSGRLKIHLRTHTGEKPFRCSIVGCGKTFTEKGNLKTHMRIHSGEKPFNCSVNNCGKTFTTQGHLTDHMRRHSGERPFKCTFCPQSFMRSSTLKIHLRRHTGEKPYECQECGKRFSESGNLKTHQKTHVNKKRKMIQNARKSNIQIAEAAQKFQRGENNHNRQDQVQSATTLGKRKRLALRHISESNLIQATTLGVKRKKTNLELSKLQAKELKNNNIANDHSETLPENLQIPQQITANKITQQQNIQHQSKQNIIKSSASKIANVVQQNQNSIKVEQSNNSIDIASQQLQSNSKIEVSLTQHNQNMNQNNQEPVLSASNETHIDKSHDVQSVMPNQIKNNLPPNPIADNESVTLQLDSTFMPHNIIPEQSSSPQLFQTQQGYSGPPLYTPKPNAGYGTSPISGFTPIQSTNPSFNFPTSLSAFQKGFQENNPSFTNTKVRRDPTAKQSFQTFFASLQQNQIGLALNNQNNPSNIPHSNISTTNLSGLNTLINRPNSPNGKNTTLSFGNQFSYTGPMSPSGGNIEPYQGIYSPEMKRSGLQSGQQQHQYSQHVLSQANIQQQQLQQSSSLQQVQQHQSSFQVQQSQNYANQQQSIHQIQPLPTMNQITQHALKNQQNNQQQQNQKQPIQIRQLSSFNNFNQIPGIQELVNTTKSFQSPPMNPHPQPQFNISSNNLNQFGFGGFAPTRSNPTSKQNSNNNLLPFSIPLNKINQAEKMPPSRMKQSTDQIGGYFDNFQNSSFPTMPLNFPSTKIQGYNDLGTGRAIMANNGAVGDQSNPFRDIQLNASISGLMLGATPHTSHNNLSMFVSNHHKVFDQDQPNASLLLQTSQQTPNGMLSSQQQSQIQHQIQQHQSSFLISQHQNQINPYLANQSQLQQQQLAQQQQQQQQLFHQQKNQQQHQQSFGQLCLAQQTQVMMPHHQNGHVIQEGGATGSIQSVKQIEEESFSSLMSKVNFQKSDSNKNMEQHQLTNIANSQQRYSQQQNHQC